MTEQQAHSRAQAISRRTGAEVFVIEEFQEDGTRFDVATEEEADTFYRGARVAACYCGGELA